MTAPAHVIVLGNEKGGSGKSTTAMHIFVALARAGFRVGAIDLDTRQKSFFAIWKTACARARSSGIPKASFQCR
jgi:chromosome partitioning protein